MKNIINWKLFFVLLAACVIAAMLVIPYTVSLTSNETKITALILLLSAAQNLILFGIVIFFGLLLAGKTGMGSPILQGLLEGKKQGKEFINILPISAGLGFLAGVLIIILSIPFDSAIPEFSSSSEFFVPAWMGFLASFYGGIGEEILLRLFVVTLLVWITFIIKKDKNGNPTIFGVWLSIVLAAIIFGLGHLPTTAQLVALTPIVILRAIILNGIGGVIFGWLYWKKGLESAMIAHFCADIVLHVITPLVSSFFA